MTYVAIGAALCLAGFLAADVAATAWVAVLARVLRDPAHRDPRAYILPADQRDFPTATKFINALRHVGVTVERATQDIWPVNPSLTLP